MSKRTRLYLEHIPLLDEWRHQQVDVVGLVEVMTHAVSQGADSVIQDQQVLDNNNIMGFSFYRIIDYVVYLVLIFVESKHQGL